MAKQKYLANFLEQMPDFVFDFVQNYYDGDSINTQLAYCIDIRIFLNFLSARKFKNKSLEDFTSEDLNTITVDDLVNFRAYLREYTIKTTTCDGREVNRTVKNSNYGINRKLSTVRSLFAYLYKTDKITQNITDKLDFTNIKQKIKKPLTTQETIRLLDVIFNGEKYYTGRDLTEYTNRKLRDVALYTAYLGTGVRVSELVNLNISDISFDTSSFVVTRKGGEEQEIFMPVQVENELYNYIQWRKAFNAEDKDALFISRLGKRITVAAVEKNLKKYCYTVDIIHPDKTRPHALRRTFACRLLEDGVDIKMVAELMGHKNIEVTHRFYAQYSSKARKEIMRSFEVIREE